MPRSQELEELARAWSARSGRVRNLVALHSVESTNTLARQVAQACDDLRTVPEAAFVALEQTAGRGRVGRSWVSWRGLGLYCSVLLYLDESAGLAALPMAAGVAIAEGLRGLGAPARLKWPNDVQIDRRKVCGILIESVSRERGCAAVIGFGVNLGHQEEQLPTPQSTSLRLAIGAAPSLAELLCELVSRLESEVAQMGDRARLVDRYSGLAVHAQGELLSCRVGEERVEGRFRGFTDRGFLRLETPQRERVLPAAEIIEDATGSS